MAINKGQGRNHPAERWERFCDYCLENRPDIIAVQEVSVDTGMVALEGLALALGYPEPLSMPIYPGQHDSQVASVVSSLEVADHYQLCEQPGRLGAQIVEFGRCGNPTLKLANVHMECRPWPDLYRRSKLGSIINHFGRPKPSIITGDFNALPWYPSIRRMYRHYSSAQIEANGREPAYTYHTELGEDLLRSGDAKSWEVKILELGNKVWRNRRAGSSLLCYTVDYTFVNEAVEVHRARTIGETEDQSFSDHLGLETEFELKKAA